ncbi:hypothetical protein ACN9NO_06895 [Glaesserella parasuis]|uniref:hypothetical protein n=1 Tax=Glaesserella parasuis TaxID=738 RepID=UPI003B222B7F
MLKIANKFIFSSISMAFLGVTGWSVAYAYGWGQSYFYGFPWWYVDVGISNVARSLGYVLWNTAILFLTYLIGLYILIKAKKYMPEPYIQFLRAYILICIGLSPLLFGYITSIGRCNTYVGLGYLLLILLFTLIFKNYINHNIPSISVKATMQFLYKNQVYIIICAYCCFVMFAFITGYIRPNFKNTFDIIDIDHKTYYILAKYSDTFILANEIHANNDNFYIYKLSPNSLFHIKVVKVSTSK